MTHSAVKKFRKITCPKCGRGELQYHLVAYCPCCDRTFLPKGQEHFTNLQYLQDGTPIRTITQPVEVIDNITGKTVEIMRITWDL